MLGQMDKARAIHEAMLRLGVRPGTPVYKEDLEKAVRLAIGSVVKGTVKRYIQAMEDLGLVVDFRHPAAEPTSSVDLRLFIVMPRPHEAVLDASTIIEEARLSLAQ